MDISPQMQNQLEQLEQLRQQLQVIGAQRSQLDSQRKETELALEGLKDLPEDAVVYRSAGSLLVQADDRVALAKELEEEKETLQVRVKTVEKQEARLRERFQELQENIQNALEGQG